MSTLAKSAFWVTISEIIFNLSGYVIHSVVGRILGPADYGRYGLVVTLTTMIIILIGNGIPTAMAKYISEIFETNPGLVKIIKRQAIILQSILISLLTVIFFFGAPLIAKILGDPTLTPLFRISTLVIPAFALASFYFSYYTGLHKFGIQSFLKIIRSVFRVVIIIALTYYFGVKGSVSGYIVAPFLVFIVAFLIDKFKITKELSHSELISESNKLDSSSEAGMTFDWRKLVNYAWQIIIFFLAYELLISIDLYLVKGILHDDYLTGIYNASLTVGRLPYYVFYALTVILLPVVSKSTAENNSEKTGEIVSQSLRLMIILLVPAIILMSQFSEAIIKIFYGNKYLAAAYPMSILVWGVGFLTIFYVLSFVMNGAGKTKKTMYMAVFGFALNAILNYFLIKKYALTGSAIATSTASFAVMAIIIFYTYRDFKISIKLKNIFRIAAAGVATFYVASLFSQGRYIFILWSVLLFAFYCAILYLLGEIKKEDFMILKNIIARKKPGEAEEKLSGNEPNI